MSAIITPSQALWTPRSGPWWRLPRLPRLRRLKQMASAMFMAAGDIMLDDDGNIMLDNSGNILLSDGAGDDCCCGGVVECEPCGRNLNDRICCVSNQSTASVSWSQTGPLPPDVESLRTGSDTLDWLGILLEGTTKYIIYRKIRMYPMDCGARYLSIIAFWNCQQHNNSPHFYGRAFLWDNDPSAYDLWANLTGEDSASGDKAWFAVVGAGTHKFGGGHDPHDCCGTSGAQGQTSSSIMTIPRPCDDDFEIWGEYVYSTWVITINNNGCCNTGIGIHPCAEAAAVDCAGECPEEGI